MATFEEQREKERAAFAYNLAKFRDREGNHLPSDEDGIALHQAAVKEYEAEYGSSQSYDYFYDGIPRSLEQERKYDARDERIKRENGESQAAVAEQLAAERARSVAERGNGGMRCDRRATCLRRRCDRSAPCLRRFRDRRGTCLRSCCDRSAPCLRRFRDRRGTCLRSCCDRRATCLRLLCDRAFDKC